jgi:hypothetical protein
MILMNFYQSFRGHIVSAKTKENVWQINPFAYHKMSRDLTMLTNPALTVIYAAKQRLNSSNATMRSGCPSPIASPAALRSDLWLKKPNRVAPPIPLEMMVISQILIKAKASGEP